MSSPGTPLQDRDAEMLSEAAELDLALARKLHVRAMAAEETAELSELTRSYQRAMRSMRQSLALKAKIAEMRARTDLARARAEVARVDAAPMPGREPPPTRAATEGLRRQAAALEDAAGRVILRFTEREEEREALFDFLGDWLSRLGSEPEFAALGVDEQLADFGDEFGIPAELYRAWRDLPPVDAVGARPDAEAPTTEPPDSG